VVRVHQSRGPVVVRRSMVHSGPWTEARPELVGAQARWRCGAWLLAVVAQGARGG
jgi:hypothetical protein